MTKFEEPAAARRTPPFEAFGPSVVPTTARPALPGRARHVRSPTSAHGNGSNGSASASPIPLPRRAGRSTWWPSSAPRAGSSSSAPRPSGCSATTSATSSGWMPSGCSTPSSVEPVRALFNDLVARRRLSVSLEMRTVRADGKPIDLEVVAANHLDDPIGGIVVNIRDITERKRLEEQVLDVDRPTGHHHRVAGRRGDDGRRRRIVVRVNEAFEVMFEAPRVRLVGRRARGPVAAARARAVEVVDVDGRAGRRRDHPIVASLRTRPTGRSGWCTASCGAAGPPMWVRANAQAMSGADGVVTGAVASFSDITAARQVGRRAAAGGAVPPGPPGHPRRGHRGLRRRGPHHRVQPGGPAAPRPRRGRRSHRDASRPTRGSAGPTDRPWPSGRTR